MEDIKIEKIIHCKVCNKDIFYKYKQHEASKKHQNILNDVKIDTTKKIFCDYCGKWITKSDRRKHYNTENHKQKTPQNILDDQILELDRCTDKKKVEQYDEDDKLLNKFDSINDAYRFLNKTYSGGGIAQCCNGKKELMYGFKWKWVK